MVSEENKVFPAYYTESFYDFLQEHDDFFEGLALDTSEHTAKFKDMFISHWKRYEIGLETEESFDIAIRDHFNKVKDYYLERINTYEQEFDWRDGIVMERDSDQTEFGMPNRQVNDPDGYQTGKVKNHSKTKGGINLVAQRNKYLASLRNIWLEFIWSFEPCFITLFS